MSGLSPTAHVILGMLGLRPMSGYEIKSLVDNSTRFFWAASYGQIYPELRRLADAGLITGEDQARGGRKRTVYALTPNGRAALDEWLSAPAEIQETRDESLLKLFFADAGGPGPVAALEAKRDHHRRIAERLRAVEEEKPADAPRSTWLTLRLGIDWNEFVADWCEREAERLRVEGAADGRKG